MSLLLDTHVIVWLATGDPRLPSRVRDYVADYDGPLCVSVVSGWEYGTKRATRPRQFRETFEELLMPDYRRLDFSFDLHVHAERLPPIHRDPFDRMLIAQAVGGSMTLLTADKAVRGYPVSTHW